MVAPLTTQKTPAQLALEKANAEAEKKARQDREVAEAIQGNSFLSTLRSFFEIFGLGSFFDAIVGSFVGSQRDNDEMPAGTTPAPSDRPTGIAQAETLLRSLGGNEKLRGLMAQYQGRIPEPISPFASVARITSHYGEREAPRDASGKIVGSGNHGGIDAVPVGGAGKPYIHATMPGVVVYSGTQRDAKGNMAGYGHWVEVAGIDGKRYRFGHLDSRTVSVGDVLQQGEVLGVMGNTGHGTGPHLHYEVRNAEGNHTLEPRINGRTYARNDRSYTGSTIAAAPTTSYASNRPAAATGLAGLVNPSDHPKLATGQPHGSQTLAFAAGASAKLGAVRGG